MDLQYVREGFPFLRDTSNFIYLDNASTTQKPATVIDAITRYYQKHSGNVSRGDHQFSRESTALYQKARESVARFIHAEKSSEIVFTKNTTDSINILTKGLAENIFKGDYILLSQAEHHSNLLPWLNLAQKKEAQIVYIPVDEQGNLTWVETLKEVSDKPVKICSLTHVSNVLGFITPVRKIFEQLRVHHPNVITILDTAQSIAHLPINVESLTCDFLVFSAHKLYGPMGIGVLYGKKERLETLQPTSFGGGAVIDVTYETFITNAPPQVFEPGTPNVSGAIGLMAAIEYVESLKMENITSYEKSLTTTLLNQLEDSRIEELRVFGPTKEKERGPVVSFTVKDIYAEDLANYLDDDGILTRAGHHCAKPLHDLILKTPSTLRVSLGLYNTEEELNRFITSLTQAVQLLRP